MRIVLDTNSSCPKSVISVRRAAVIDRCNKVLSGAEPEGAVANGLDLVVHSLDSAVGDALLGPCQNPIKIRAKRAHELLERLQPRAHGRAHPFLQLVLGTLGLLVIPEHLEGFFAVVSARNRRVPPHQRRQALFLVVSEIPGILQQQPGAALKCHLFLLAQAAHFAAPDFFDGFVEVPDDVEPVEQDLGLGVEKVV